MSLPDKYATEPTREIDPDHYQKWLEAKDQVKQWQDEASRLQALLDSQLAGSHAGTINGAKVLLNRPQNKWAINALKNDFPDLCQHFTKWVQKQEIDLTAMHTAHPEIVDRYRVRSFRKVGE